MPSEKKNGISLKPLLWLIAAINAYFIVNPSTDNATRSGLLVTFAILVAILMEGSIWKRAQWFLALIGAATVFALITYLF